MAYMSSTNPRHHLVASETNIYPSHDPANTVSLTDIIHNEHNISVPFYQGTFEEARRAAQTQNRYLVVYLHCPTHENTSSFVKNVLHDSKLMTSLRESAILYGASVMNSEGHRLSSELHATTYPFVAVLYQRTLVMRLQGVYARAVFVAEWKKCTDLWDGVLAEETSLRAERELQERERRAADEREAADKERLARVRQVAQARLQRENDIEAAARQRSEEEVAQDAERLEREAQQALRRQTSQAAARSRLPAEPQSEVDSERVTQINLRYPSGRQYFRRFWRTDLVESLLDFAHSVDDYNGEEVQLLVGVPPKPIVWTGGVTKFNDVPSLTPRVTVLVRSKANKVVPRAIRTRVVSRSETRVLAMFACARCALVRFQPYAMAVQTRFKWRHKETDRWRRLMDATCFQLDWLGQTRGPNFSQYSGHWTHILTCAHVITPWNYPNFYPPTGPTRFVTHITLADTMTQIRLPSLQGTAVYKHFTSNQHVYAHSNPRLDLCVLHAEQNLRRSGEMKMLWLQNEGYVIRPRLELVTPLCVGDVVWMYGMHAQESLFDEEKAPEPRMVPVGLRARVLHLTREHFFLDTLSMNGGDGGGLSGNSAASHAGGDEAAAAAGEVGMGMCGSVIMRHGRCVGMLTATVHRESSCRELAGAAMCTYAHDIFEFLLEVEKQMKNPVAPLQQEETVFQKRRRCDEPTEEEASHPKQSPCSHDGSRRETQSDDTEEHGSRRRRHTSEHRDWELDGTRIAHHIPVPVSLWHMEEKWITEEDHITNAVFGRSGVFNQETQESALHLDMNSAKSSGERPHEMPIYSAVTRGNKVTAAGERKDYSPRGVYTEDSRAFRSSDDVWERNVQDEVDSLFRQSVDDKCVHNLDALRQSLERIRNQRATEKMTETVLKYSGGHEDPLNMGMGTGHYQASAHAGAANFSPRSRTEEEEEEKEKTMPRYHSSADKNDCTSGCRVNERRCDVAASSSAQRAEGSYKGGREVCGETRSTLHHGEGCPAQGIAAEGQSTSSEGGCRDMSHTDAAMHHIRRSSHDERHSDSSHSTATSTLRRVHAANIARKKRERDEGEAKARADLERCHKRPVEVHSDEMMYTVWRSSGQ